MKTSAVFLLKILFLIKTIIMHFISAFSLLYSLYHFANCIILFLQIDYNFICCYSHWLINLLH